MASIATLSGRFNAVETGMGTRLQATEHSIVKLTEEFQKERQDVVTVVKEVNVRVDELASAVQDDRNNLGAAVSAAIDQRLSQMETSRLSSGGIIDTLPLSVASSSRDAIREEKYLLARRSLLIWPLQTGDLAGVQAFAMAYLGMSQEDVDSFRIAKVIACRGAPGSKVVSEYSVEFSTISDRDSFRSYAPKLAPHRNTGIRLAVPDFMMTEFKVLENEGFLITKRKPGTRRNIKYDDATRSLVIDVKLPDAAWVRITAAQILDARKKRKEERLPEVDEILSVPQETQDMNTE